MIKTTLGKLAMLRDRSSEVGPLTKLCSADQNTAYADRILIGRFLKPLITAINEYEKDFALLLNRFADQDPNNSTNYIFRKKDEIAKYVKEVENLHAIEIEIAAMPLPQKVLVHLPLTPLDLHLLSDFMEDF